MVLMALMRRSQVPANQPRSQLKLKKEYSLFYVLAVLTGARKQIFLTFAPWVIVTIYNKPTQVIATLILIGGVVGILIQPFLGKLIDRLGERTILMAEALLLVPVCLAYGFSKFVFSANTAFLITCACYLIDQVLMSVGMARSTYMKKIAVQASDIQPALSASVTIDHFFSIGVALIGGVIWNKLGFQYVFLMGVLIAAGNFIATRMICIPKSSTSQPAIIDEPVTIKD
jgi:predicted MFS family arabinose efflux permease